MTDDCPIPFGARAPSLPDLLPLGFLWNYQGDDLQLCLTFTEDMDTGKTPPASAFVIEVDAADKVPDSVQWLNSRVFQLNYNEASLGPVAVRCILDESQPAFHSVGFQPVSPFDILGAEQTFTGLWEFTNPPVTITLTTNLSMEEGEEREESIWDITWAAFSSQPDNVEISSPNDIILILDNPGSPTGPFNTELTGVNSNYKNLDGLFLCPFLLTNIPEDT